MMQAQQAGNTEVFSFKNAKIAVFISGRGSNLLQLITNVHLNADCPAKIALVVSSERKAQGLRIAQDYAIDTFIPQNVANECDYDDCLHEKLQEESIDLICMAGFMRLLSQRFVQRWYGRILNIHPSLLPAFPGLHSHKKVLKRGSLFSGCTVHFVDNGVDTGPIIGQACIPLIFCQDRVDAEEYLSKIILEMEHVLYSLVVKKILSCDYCIQNERVLWYGRTLSSDYSYFNSSTQHAVSHNKKNIKRELTQHFTSGYFSYLILL